MNAAAAAVSKYRLIQHIDGRLVVGAEGNIENVVPALEVRGFPQAGVVECSRHLRPELIGQPRFQGVVGPMWDGDAIRYEDPQNYEVLSA